jgi:hypothetical protein
MILLSQASIACYSKGGWLLNIISIIKLWYFHIALSQEFKEAE